MHAERTCRGAFPSAFSGMSFQGSRDIRRGGRTEGSASECRTPASRQNFGESREEKEAGSSHLWVRRDESAAERQVGHMKRASADRHGRPRTDQTAGYGQRTAEQSGAAREVCSRKFSMDYQHTSRWHNKLGCPRCPVPAVKTSKSDITGELLMRFEEAGKCSEQTELPPGPVVILGILFTSSACILFDRQKEKNRFMQKLY